MREIKFRAWVISTKEMVDISSNENEYLMSHLESDYDWKVMQYTGLKDKNGKEIYEGDILLDECDGAIPFAIEWKKEQWVEDGFVSGFTCLTSGANCYTIIGNIYENPSLLTNKPQ